MEGLNENVIILVIFIVAVTVYVLAIWRNRP